MKQEHQKNKLSDTSQLSHIQENHERLLDENEQLEQTFQMSKGEMRSKVKIYIHGDRKVK